MDNKQLILSIVILLFFVSSTNAFDGNRKGFVLGGGGGYSTTFYPDNTKGSLNLNLSIGYGFSNKFVLLLDKVVRYYRINNRDGMSQVDTYRLYHYFSNTKKSFFSSIGYSYVGADGLTIGGGYATSKNLQVGLFYYNDFKENNISSLSIILCYTAF